jgi:hypothetical protein
LDDIIQKSSYMVSNMPSVYILHKVVIARAILVIFFSFIIANFGYSQNTGYPQNVFKDYDLFVEAMMTLGSVISPDEAKDNSNIIEKAIDKAFNSTNTPISEYTELNIITKKFIKDALYQFVIAHIKDNNSDAFNNVIKKVFSELNDNLKDVSINRAVKSFEIPKSGNEKFDQATHTFVQAILNRAVKTASSGASVEDVKNHFSDLVDYTSTTGDVVSGLLSEGANQLKTLSMGQSIVKKKLLPPTNVRATKGQFSDRVIITWDSVPYAESYKIIRMDCDKKLYNVAGTTFGNTSAEKTKFVDKNLPALRYIYLVQAQAPYCCCGEGGELCDSDWSWESSDDGWRSYEFNYEIEAYGGDECAIP